MKSLAKQRGFITVSDPPGPETSLAPTLIKTIAASSGRAVRDIFHPGHWYFASGANALPSSFLNEPNLVGAKMMFRWRWIERDTPSVYDWTLMDARMAECQAAGKYMSITLQKEKFGGDPPNTPDYMWTDPSFGGDPTYYGNIAKLSQPGWRAYIENTNVETAYKAFETAIMARFGSNPWFEGMVDGETSLDQPEAGIEAAYKRIVLNARDLHNAVGKYYMVYVNFAGFWAPDPGESREETASKWVLDNGMGLGGPDLKEGNSLLNNGMYMVARDRNNDAPIAVDVQWADYDPSQNTDKDVREILAFGNGEVFGVITPARAAESPHNWIQCWENRAPWYSGSPVSPKAGNNVLQVVASDPVNNAETFYDSIERGQYP